MASASRVQNFRVDHLQVAGVAPVSFTLEPGQALVLRGPSGVGKTRLLRALADLEPHRGEVWLDGVRHMQTPPPQWRSLVCLVPAESAWWEDTVAAHFKAWPPQNLDKLGLTSAIGESNVAHLSSGERMRLAVQRAWELKPRVLLLDEPSANLDPDNRTRLTARLNAWRHDRHVMLVCASHDGNLHQGLQAAELELRPA